MTYGSKQLLLFCLLEEKALVERHPGQAPTTQGIASSLSGTSHPPIIIEIYLAANFLEDSNAPTSRSSQRRAESIPLPLPSLVKYVYLQELHKWPPRKISYQRVRDVFPHTVHTSLKQINWFCT